MQKITKIFSGALIIAVIVLAGCYFVIQGGYLRQEGTPSVAPVSQPKSQQPKELPVSYLEDSLIASNEKNALLLLKFTEVDWAMFEAEVVGEMTVFDLLKKGALELKLELKTKDYKDMGILVEKIGDKNNGDEGKYWLYSVNSKMAEVAADKQKIKARDVIEWKFEKSTF